MSTPIQNPSTQQGTPWTAVATDLRPHDPCARPWVGMSGALAIAGVAALVGFVVAVIASGPRGRRSRSMLRLR